MNLITCTEDCIYQKDGYCILKGGAPVNAVRVNGCSYYQKQKDTKTQHKEKNNARL